MNTNNTGAAIKTTSSKTQILMYTIFGSLIGAAIAVPLTVLAIAGDPSSTAALLLILTVPFGFVVGAVTGLVCGVIKHRPIPAGG